MRYIADLHIHSHYSRATSPDLNLEHLYKWAQLKGLSVVATGDLTHPRWLEEMRDKLQESAAGGLYTLTEAHAAPMRREIPAPCANNVYYILSGEISNIYKKDGKVRKVHNVVLFPSLESVALFQQKLERIGNIRSDGRPILGLDSRDLLEMVLESDPRAVLIPAHIWTPWFSLLGSKSGFDSVQECYGDLSEHIFALETGLSSDPPMNWRLSILDQYNLVSNSDAHSPAKLAREANVFNTGIDYDAMIAALKNHNGNDFWGTIEFFPEEGKYHMDGHRKCACMTCPAETMQNNGLCPVCGKPSTLGVSYRVEELADRPEGGKPANAKNFASLIPLPEVIAEVKSSGPNSKSVLTMYNMLLRELGPELAILMDIPIADLECAGGTLLAEAIRRMRAGEVSPEPGYDGEYGIIRVFKDDERKSILQQGQLFGFEGITMQPEPEKTAKPVAPVQEKQAAPVADVIQESTSEYGLNEEQTAAVQHRGAPLIIQAGPGTGKTRTLTRRIAALITSGLAKPQQVLAVTFTNKAAREMRDRLFAQLGAEIAGAIGIKTFHAFGADLLRQAGNFLGRNSNFTIINSMDDAHFKKLFQEQFNIKLTNSVLETISALKSQGYYPDGIPKEVSETLPEQLPIIYKYYEQLLIESNAVDYDDLIGLALQVLRKNPELRRQVLQNTQFLAVDEFQDINRAQYELFVILAVAAQEVCVIGDPDQAIYGFRGASREFFYRFNRDFPNAVAMKLRRNYRSAQNIVQASRQILDSREQTADAVWSNLAPEVKVNLHSSPTDRAEAEYIVHTIEQLIGGVSFFSIDSKRVDDRGLPQDYSFADIAVLLRTRSLVPPLVEALSRSGIPFETFDDSRLLAQERVAFITATLRWLQNPHTGSLVEQHLAFCFANSNESLTGHIQPDFQHYLASLQTLPKDTPVREYLEKIWSFAMQLYPGNPEDDRAGKRKLLELSAPFAERLDKLADALALHSVIDDYDGNADKVHILTLHACKGLEFPVVFIAGCEETIIPYRQPGRHSDIEEEKRLLYVGMTRAQQQLYLTHCKSRMLYGQSHSQTPSRFLTSISASLLNREKSMVIKKKKDDQLALF